MEIGLSEAAIFPRKTDSPIIRPTVAFGGDTVIPMQGRTALTQLGQDAVAFIAFVMAPYRGEQGTVGGFHLSVQKVLENLFALDRGFARPFRFDLFAAFIFLI